MGSVIEGVKTINSAVRTVLLAALVGAIGIAGFYGYSEYTKRERLLHDQETKLAEASKQLVSLQSDLQSKAAEIESLAAEVRVKSQQIERLETSIHLLKTDQRLAQLQVISIERDETGKALTSKLRFVELSPQGEPISEGKVIELPGDLVYVDNWVVKFEDKFIESADLERGTSLCLFRRIFSEEQVPNEGFSLDEIGMRPQAYARGGAMSEFESKLWADFWEFANDPIKASEMGIRAANGEAVAIKVKENRVYNVTLRSSGGLSIEPVQLDSDSTGVE